MKAAILNIGNEVLLGHTINTNLSLIAKKLLDYGILVGEQRTVEDDPKAIIKAVHELLVENDLIISSGGLGPTEDDLTSPSIAQALNRQLVLNNQVLEDIQAYFARTKRTMSPNNKNQAYFPQGAKIYKNDLGTASGFSLQEGEKTILVLPGPPREVENILDKFLKDFSPQKQVLLKTINTFGLGESFLENQLRLLKLGRELLINTYFNFNGVDIKILADLKDQEAFQRAIEKIQGQFAENIYDTDSSSISLSLLKQAKAKNKKIAFAESCTGGKLSSAFVENPSASDVLLGSLVTYTEEAKMKILGVKEETLKAYTAVSEETAREMLQGLKNIFDADLYAVTTGYASPTGDPKTNGLVYIGLYSKKDKKTQILENHYHGSRQQIIDRVTANVYFNLMKLI
ncbi:MAG: CinA family nicotinamide mononucleotide deamidase-related protein [Bacillota bacterium]|nr:CinA family nicotinamide mononucleotide deamidase-related protein [Bacillota bacterium]